MPTGGIEWMKKLPDCGRHVVTDAEASANAAVINTGRPDATGFIVQVHRANVNATSDAVATLSAGVLTVGDGSGFNLTAADVITWTVF